MKRAHPIVRLEDERVTPPIVRLPRREHPPLREQPKDDRTDELVALIRTSRFGRDRRAR